MLEWKDFIAQSLEANDCPNFGLSHDALGLFHVSAITAINRAIVKQALKKGYKGVAISVCDYTREAILFGVSQAIENALKVEESLSRRWDEVPSGAKLSLGSVVVEFLEISRVDSGSLSGDYFRYVQPDGKRGKKTKGNSSGLCKYGAPLNSIPYMHECPGDTPLTARSSKKLSDEISEYNALPEAMRKLRDAASSATSAVCYGSSQSPSANIPPSALHNIDIEIDGVRVPITDLFITGRISNGEIKQASKRFPLKGQPSLLASSRTSEGIADPFDFYEYLDEGGSVHSIVLEIPSEEVFQAQLGEIRDIVEEFDIPIIAFCDEEAFEDRKPFEDLGMLTFSWTKGMLKELNEALPANSELLLSAAEKNVANLAVRYKVIDDDGRFTKCAETLNRLKEKRSVMSEQEKLSLASLMRAYNHAIKRTEMLTEDEAAPIVSAIESAVEVLSGPGGSYSLSQTEKKLVELLEIDLKAISVPDVALPKENIAFEMVSHIVETMNRNACLIVSSDSSAKSSTAYWMDVLRYEGIEYEDFAAYTPRRFTKLAGINENYEVLVSGWFYSSEMRRLLHSGISSSYTVLLYKDDSNDLLETAYYRANTDYWKTLENKMLAASIDALAQLDIHHEKPRIESKSTPQNVLGTMDEILRNLQNDLSKPQFFAKGEEVALGRLVWFANGSRRWLRASETGGDSLLVVTNILEEHGDYSRKTAASIVEGDLVLKAESDDEALRETCRMFGSFDKAFTIARSWYEPIEKAKSSFSDLQIRKKIVQAGCRRTTATIDRWISSKSLIAPDEAEDIKAIHEAFGHPISDEQLQRILVAASICRGERIKSGRIVSHDIAEAFVSDARAKGSLDAASKEFEKAHPGLGSVEVLRVEYIGDPALVSVSKFGWFQD